MKLVIAYLICLLNIFSFSAFAEIAGSFSTAKKWAEQSIYHDRRISFYCGCLYSKNKIVNSDSCNYVPRKPFTNSGNVNVRANRIEWEHVLPASSMGKHLSCWGGDRGNFPQCIKSNGKLRSGRKCCQKVNDTFRKAHNDLVNLTPAVGEINADRSNYPYDIIENETRKYGKCDFEVENKVAEPAENIRGDIARIQFYLLHTYSSDLGFTFSPEKISMFNEWSVSDPISDWEIKRNRRICDKQGSGNLLVGECN